jgi:hypothetical protein
VIGQTSEMFPAPEPEPEYAPPPPPLAPPTQKIAKLDIAKDVLLAVGLVSGIVISVASLWALLRKYRKPPAQTAGPG